MPLGATLTGGDDLPLPRGAIAARVGGLPAGERTTQQSFDESGDYISGLMTLESQTVRSVIFEYELPRTILNITGSTFEYVLDVLVQAGARGRNGTIYVTLPDGYDVVVEESTSLVSLSPITIAFEAVRDETIILTVRKN